MNGRISKLIRRNARAVAGRYADNPPNYTLVPGSVRQKLVHTHFFKNFNRHFIRYMSLYAL